MSAPAGRDSMQSELILILDTASSSTPISAARRMRAKRTAFSWSLCSFQCSLFACANSISGGFASMKPVRPV
ncbi:hypothetical protein D3C85_1880570 [compost metagenome]